MIQGSSRPMARCPRPGRGTLACCLLALATLTTDAGAQGSGQQQTETKQVTAQPPAAADPAPPEIVEHVQQLHLLENRLTMREPFNEAGDAIRIVAFLAPSCPRCLKNAGELQREVLDANKDADIAVFTVWMHVLKKDDEAAAREAMSRIPDTRAHHFWDPDRKLLHQLRDAIMFDVNLRLYDVFLLYDGDAVWEKRVPRPNYWMHEYKGVHGPWWDVKTFAAEVAKGLRGEPFANPLN